MAATVVVFVVASLYIATVLSALLKPRQYTTIETDVAYDGHNASVVRTLDGCMGLGTSNATCTIKDSVGVRRHDAALAIVPATIPARHHRSLWKL
ncbi:hypothetical protein SPRG_10945 [Saprolegnia parasitica CBS 223.65]|uniref:DUF4333 domain-containing protein n=1 Tax=Saprolegnia parasitica (strain CBS 223.65) TaxID=695850 RepID=A0A067C6F8_SAPPC|nr:hypothetical protein SPRG_10945 [Saprolegnia parasitica CBS 223.65]KDO22126.1 hypothetical protein SPRG_10945 [Saprolegnia parasitica CBS 223.65]|eukprot:XP_012207165.1 hypothetical protein SPRG_10945 [Saprolegnia parasitica CBS 223.65]